MEISEYNHIDNSLLEYIKTEKTDYAILLNGEWGSGKTFYINNHFSTKLANQNENYRIIHVSLFGIKNLSDLNNRIVVELYDKVLDNKIAKSVKGLGQVALSYFGVSTDGIQELLKAESFINSKHILVLDDLERIDSNMIKEVLGFINSLSEQKNTKIIILTNQSKMAKDVNHIYNVYLEKVFRYTIQFELNFVKVANQLLKESEIDDLAIQLVIDSFYKRPSTNLRSLQFVRDNLIKIRSVEVKGEEEKINKIMQKAIAFLVSISIEYKEHAFHLPKVRELKRWSLEVPTDWSSVDLQNIRVIQDGDEKEKEDNRSIQQKYFDLYWGREMFYFDSIIDLIEFGFLDEAKFKSECDEFLDFIKIKESSEAKKGLQSLVNFQYLKDNQIIDVANQVRAGINDQEYNLVEYLNAFNRLQYLIKQEIIDLDYEELKAEIIDAINAYKGQDNPNVELAYSYGNLLDDPDFKELHDSAVEVNNKLIAEESREENMKIFNQLVKSPLEFYDLYSRKEIEIPIFNNTIPSKDFLNHFLDSSNEEKLIYIRLIGTVLFRVRDDTNEATWFAEFAKALSVHIKKQESRTISLTLKEILLAKVEAILPEQEPPQKETAQ